MQLYMLLTQRSMNRCCTKPWPSSHRFVAGCRQMTETLCGAPGIPRRSSCAGVSSKRQFATVRIGRPPTARDPFSRVIRVSRKCAFVHWRVSAGTNATASWLYLHEHAGACDVCLAGLQLGGCVGNKDTACTNTCSQKPPLAHTQGLHNVELRPIESKLLF